jgi:hypothetical protein
MVEWNNSFQKVSHKLFNFMFENQLLVWDRLVAIVFSVN